MAVGFNPHFELAYRMTENMVNTHAGELSYAELNWDRVENKDGKLLQLVPILILQFKGLSA